MHNHYCFRSLLCPVCCLKTQKKLRIYKRTAGGSTDPASHCWVAACRALSGGVFHDFWLISDN